MVQRITPTQPWPLHSTAATRTLEAQTASALPAHTLMQRAGLATARLARALAPHANTCWVACGPGNNGGDGLEAAMHLQQAGYPVCVTWLGHPDQMPADARQSWQKAVQAGVPFISAPPQHLGPRDLVIDALLGLGVSASAPTRALPPSWQPVLEALHRSPATYLAVDLPSGLDADTGQFAPGFAPAGRPHRHQHTISLLTLKPGLFTAHGRDSAGTVWLDTLGALDNTHGTAWLSAPPPPPWRPHASHKGTQGDVAVIGGEGVSHRGMGMTGAALLAARAALHAGAGRVMVALLDAHPLTLDPEQPELMFRTPQALDLAQLTAACGCGGGQAIEAQLPLVLAATARLVLDADALNAIAASPALQTALRQRASACLPTVLTPHPLEAARLLGCTTAEVQAHRLQAAQRLTERFQCVTVLKGSGTIIASPHQPAHINPTGNALLATAGTGDVLAGMIAAAMATAKDPFTAAAQAVYRHGQLADQWPAHQPLTAQALARQMGA